MIGAVINNYKVEKLIGEGGMGNVYLAIHEQLGRKVAIKALHSFLVKNDEIRKRFKNEATTLLQLQHPNIVYIYDYIEYNDGAFLIMEYVEGKPLDKYIQTVTGPIPEERAVSIFMKILDGVEYAHSKNIIHRDIKPSNIIITNDEDIKILDFGIAKIVDEPTHNLTKTGSKVGTVLYMSPEQVRGKELSKATDIYSLGITFFEILTGKCPYSGTTSEYEVYTQIVNEDLPSPSKFYPAVTLQLEMILRKATQKDPSLRYNNCDEFRESILRRNDKDPIKIKFKAPKKKVIIAFAALLLIVVLFGSIKMLFFNSYNDLYVLSYTLALRKSNNDKAQKLANLSFGDTVSILNSKVQRDKNNLDWIEVKTKRGKKGYVVMNYLGESHEREIIEHVFGEYNQHSTIAVVHKRAVAKYFEKNGFVENDSQKVTYTMPQPTKSNSVLPFAIGDFNNDAINDFACIVESKKLNNTKLIIFISENSEKFQCTLDLDYKDKFKIRTIPKGKDGGGWYIGNKVSRLTDWGGKYKEDKYELLTHDALLFIYDKSNEVSIYYYNLPENKFKAYKQKK